jgi:hypothetical protein
MVAAAVAFDPMFLFFALGIAAVVAVGRLLFAWAVGSS